MRSSRRRVPSSTSSRQGLGSGKTNRDLSVTQFALMDDENVSATQQVTRGGGGESFCYTPCIVYNGQREGLKLKLADMLFQD